ncbi:MAG: glucosaminidase domain-containing protein [Leptolyngbyaceae cyanobacterium bins.302]|nr:glucosaminidase domain-containing protein [Leptolyngbyaceae cyanobacterium bins.302]
MGRIFISVEHHSEQGRLDPGGAAIGLDITAIRDLLVSELRSRSMDVMAVPDELEDNQTIRWINSRDRAGDIALELYANSHPNPEVRGTRVYYIAHNDERKQHADLILLALTRRLPQLVFQGALPDTYSEFGRVRFCRQLVPASLYLQIGFITNPDDRFLIQNQRQEVAQGIADGLVAWSRAIAEGEPPALLGQTIPPSAVPTPININVNGRLYGELGVLLNGNAYISVDLADRLGMQRTSAAQRYLTHGNVVYVQAIELRDSDISASWDATTRTLTIRTMLQISRSFHEISGRGHTTEVQMLMFLKARNEVGLSRFPDIARLYLEEGMNEGIRYDVAFAQMCVETEFLQFGGSSKPSQNNFGGLGTVGGNPEGASFPSRRIGVRAHIQHLKAYANTEPLREEIVDPRFNLVIRGGAPTIAHLTGRWSADPHYSDRILAVLRQLYETAGLI